MGFVRNKIGYLVLAVVAVIAAGWGFTHYQARQQWELNAKNQYQRAFEDLVGHTNNMETELTKIQAATSFPQSLRMLTNIWREANASQENLGQLPLTSLDLSKTKTFLAQAATYSLNTTQKKLIEGHKLGKKEFETLGKLRDQSRIITKQLMEMQGQFMAGSGDWLDLDKLGKMKTAVSAGRFNNNKVSKSFLMLEDGLRRVPDLQFEGSNLDYQPKPTGLFGEKVTSKEAGEKLRGYLGEEYKDAEINYERMIKGGFPSFMFLVKVPGRPANSSSPRTQAPTKGNQKELRCSVSEKGGHLVWLMGDWEHGDRKLDLKECAKIAIDFCRKAGYPRLKNVAQESYAGVASYTLVPERNGVLYYPELVKAQVTQDKGEIIGCDAVNYLTFNEGNKAKIPTPKLSEQDIRRLCNENLKIKQIRKAQVLDEMYNKVLCYEVEGTVGDDLFLVYYNANTGKEEKIRRIDKNGNEIQ